MRDENQSPQEEPKDGGGVPVSEQSATDTPRPPSPVGEVSLPDAPSEPASVHVIVMDDRTRIVVSGEVDADLAADLQEATSDAEATGLPIEVDAQHVTFMDSSGIAFLARLASRSAEKVRVLRAPETVRFLLEVTRIGELLDLVDDATHEGAASPEPAPAQVPAGGPGRTPDDAA